MTRVQRELHRRLWSALLLLLPILFGVALQMRAAQTQALHAESR